jgi:hypothetical protein
MSSSRREVQVEVEWLALLLLIRKVPASILGLLAGFPD